MAEIAEKTKRRPSDLTDEERAGMAAGQWSEPSAGHPPAALRARLAKNASTSPAPESAPPWAAISSARTSIDDYQSGL
jgi:hypothetical protein